MRVPKPARSKTINLGLLLVIAGWAQAELHVFTAHLTPSEQGALTSFVGLLVVVLRFLTTGPVSEK